MLVVSYLPRMVSIIAIAIATAVIALSFIVFRRYASPQPVKCFCGIVHVKKCPYGERTYLELDALLKKTRANIEACNARHKSLVRNITGLDIGPERVLLGKAISAEFDVYITLKKEEACIDAHMLRN